jgi:glyoxylase-like metal-dependent hydrolase (beta-lactamase superfamily II)
MIPLEDTVTDVIGKAQRGLGISDSQLAERTGMTAEEVRRARSGNADRAALTKIAAVLELDVTALSELASGSYNPAVQKIDGVATFTTPFEDMTVNAYLVWQPHSKDAVVFDTGADCSELLRMIETQHLNVRLVLLTHAHPDHVADLRRLRDAIDAPVYVSGREPAAGAEPLVDGREFNVGDLHVKPLLTWGHSPGGITYFITGLAKPIAVVGDSIFAGSMGGGNVSYADAVENNLQKILALPNETIICPGHGPLTTVANEKAHNPFFAAKFRR